MLVDSKNYIDLNCDMGEGMASDVDIMPFISSANIACGFHAGNEETLKRTVDLCLKNNVAAGAHPSFKDRDNFGRIDMALNEFQLYDIICDQLYFFENIAFPMGCIMHHVKPHGALYNMAAKDKTMAQIIVRAVKDFDDKLVLYGLSGSYMVSEAEDAAIKAANESFADRSYQDDGSLTPRSQSNALLQNMDEVGNQVLQMVKDGAIITVSGNMIRKVTDTICLHGDGENAVLFAKEINKLLIQNGVGIRKI